MKRYGGRKGRREGGREGGRESSVIWSSTPKSLPLVPIHRMQSLSLWLVPEVSMSNTVRPTVFLC